MLKFIFLIAIIIIGCGGKYEVVHKGKIDVVFKVETLERYFRAECEATVLPEEVDHCIDEKLGKLFSLIVQ